jgi:hypothetical protein
MEQEHVGTYLVKKTHKGKLIGAMAGTKMSLLQASAVKKDRRKSSWVTTEALRGMLTVKAVHGLDSQGLGEAHGGDDPSLGITSGKFKLEDILGAEAPSCYEGILRKSRGYQKEDVCWEFSMSGGYFTDDGVGRTASKNGNPKKPGLEAGSNVTSLFGRKHTRAAELLAEQKITNIQARVAVVTAECLQ